MRENWKQFSLLVIVNAFVGGMIGMERSIFPQFAEIEFGIASKTAILTFIVAFGISKALANYFTGRLSNRFGRKRLLVIGWILAIPVPFMLMFAESWSFVIAANVILGISQGLTWSSTVVMKIDLVGEKNRGFAMGLNEFAGYLSLGIVAFLTGYIANRYGLSPYPFYLGVFISVIGLLISLIWVHDTSKFVKHESNTSRNELLDKVFIQTSFKNKTLSSVTQAGLINNLNDGMIWGLLPMVLIGLNFNNENTGLVTSVYPIVWGVGQLFTGKMADHYSKKGMLFWGMLLQGLAILLIPIASELYMLIALSAILGLGTALVYPTFLTTIASATAPQQRAESIGVFRLWRDLGYAFGAIISGITADLLGINYAIIFIGLLTITSAMIIKLRMPEQRIKEKECLEPEDLREQIISNQSIQIIDVREPEEFLQSHIPMAINIPAGMLESKMPELDKNAEFIVVCGKGGGRSAAAARLLSEFGLQVKWLCGGNAKWYHLAN